MSSATLLAMTSVAPSPVDTTTTTTGQLTWTFNSGSEAFNFLNTTDTLELKYTLRATDDSLAFDDQFVTITITGTNDVAVITGTSSGSVTGATSSSSGTPTATGDLLATDVDNTNDAFQAVGSSTASASGYGTYTISPTGVWVYTLDNANAAVEALGNGGTLNDSFTVFSQDGTAQVVNISINGADDRVAPTDIKLIIDSPLTDPSNMNFDLTGTLVATDVDPGDFTYTLVSQAVAPSGGSPATFSISDDNLLSAGGLGQNRTYTLEITATQTGDPVGMSTPSSSPIITGSNGNASDSLSIPRAMTSCSVEPQTISCSAEAATIPFSGMRAAAGSATAWTVALVTTPYMAAVASTRSTPAPVMT